MKNKRVFKYWIKSLGNIVISAVLTYIIAIPAREVIILLHRYTEIRIIDYIWTLWNTLQYENIGRYLNIIAIVPLFLIINYAITYKSNKSLVTIIEETEIISNGNLDKLIDIEATGDMRSLADNINNISTQLKGIMIEERKAQKTKNDLITNVSHDLRTPLTSIIGYLELIDADKYKDEVELRYYTDIAYQKAKDLSLLINDLFELTKMQNSAITLEKLQINLVDLLGQLVVYFKNEFEKANMEARINFSEDKLIVYADGRKLGRAFENLLSNSIKYGKDGPYVDIITRVEDSMAVVEIVNYGEPIPEIDLPYIFDRFYRVEKSRNRDIGGTGLGLAITKNIIELHNGSISADSDYSKTTFEVRLPLSSNEMIKGDT
ncbi:sensor histidine kinase [Clostridium sp. LP20]|uniref:sensor histidine kinase n=1 Tax=Clostridium sp. LP20 TaxID=3418665 RepID=UPI003EE72B56